MKISIKDIGKVKLPDDLPNESDEEKIFESKEEDTHKDHKFLRGTEQALELAKQKIRTLTIRNDDLSQLGPHRRIFSWWILGFSIFFVICTLLLVLLSSYQIPISEKLSTGQ